MDRRQALTRGAALVTAPLLFAGPARALVSTIGATTVRFATPAQGRAVLGADDDWVEATSEFHRRATLGVRTPVSREQLRAFCADAVLPWPAPLEARWAKGLATLAPRYAELRIPLPPEVLLIHTNGRDAANAPYTRRNAVALPITSAPADGSGDAFVLAHELFHVASRHAPTLATRLYALIGFEPVAPLQWPAEWLPLRIANPDATHDRHAMRTMLAGRAVALMPLLVARRAELKAGETFFSVLDVRLLEVSTGDASLPVRGSDGEPVWHAPEAVPEYLKRLGGNTGYIIHPEETMADNVAMLATNRPVPNPALLKRIEAVLRA
jgi:hypothetical protein